MNFLFTKQGFQLQLNRFPYQPDALNGVWVTHLSTFLQWQQKQVAKHNFCCNGVHKIAPIDVACK